MAGAMPTVVIDGIELCILTPEQAGSYLNKGQKTLANWRSAHKGPPYIMIGGRPAYRVDHLNAWIAAHEVSGGDLSCLKSGDW